MRSGDWACSFAGLRQMRLPAVSAPCGSFPWKVKALVLVWAGIAGSFPGRLRRAQSLTLLIAHVVSLFPLLTLNSENTFADGFSQEKSVPSTPAIGLVYFSRHAETGPVIRMRPYFSHIPA